ncbi:MAG: DUF3426 domain-containing protein [Geobacter sp.]|nr:MAG: DUF3426 domain-containing protein [Geobacter sp.]
MILQCDQCNTKFRLDDSKLKPGGVKVRCSKCRHVFVAGAEQKPEESDFDALLSGLGAPTPAQAEAVVSAAEQQAGGEPGVEASKPDEADDGLDFGAINIETGVPAGKEEPAAGAVAPSSDEFEFSAEPVAASAIAPAAADLDFGELSFDETPAAPKTEPAPAAAAGGLDFGELSFEETPAAVKEEPAAEAASTSVDFGEFSFEETPAAVKEEAAPSATSASVDFGEFSFDETPAAPSEKTPEAAGEAIDFGELSFDETPAAAKEEPAPAPAAATDDFDFGEFSFDEPPAATKEETPAVGAASDAGEFSFDEAPAPAASAAPAGESFDFGDFSFEEQAAAEAEEPAGPSSAGFESFAAEEESPAPQQPAVAEPAPPAAAPGEFSLGGFSFGAKSEEPPAGEGTPAEPVAPAGAAAVEDEAAKTAAKSSSLDFSFGDKSFAGSVPDEAFDDELPPLSISSRRKGRSVLTIAVVTICMVVVLALTGAGLYVLQSGPDALKKLDKLGIGFVAKWFGMEVPEEGRITIKNPLASFHQNKEAGELFVVTGEAVNSFRKARASIQVKVSIFDKAGRVLLQKTAYCGNRLSDEQLSTLPVAKIESIMNNQFGDSLSNLGVKPDQSIGFVVALANVPKEAADFGVEVVGSTVAAGQ